jgi:hypothetical protein
MNTNYVILRHSTIAPSHDGDDNTKVSGMIIGINISNFNLSASMNMKPW